VCQSEESSDRVLSYRPDYKVITILRQWEEQSWSSNPQSDISSKEHFHIFLNIVCSIASYPLTAVKHFRILQTTQRKSILPHQSHHFCMPFIRQRSSKTTFNCAVTWFADQYLWYQEHNNVGNTLYLQHQAERLCIEYIVILYVKVGLAAYEEYFVDDTPHNTSSDDYDY